MSEKDAKAVAMWDTGCSTRRVEVTPGQYLVQVGDGGGTWWSAPEGTTAVELTAGEGGGGVAHPEADIVNLLFEALVPGGAAADSASLLFEKRSDSGFAALVPKGALPAFERMRRALFETDEEVIAHVAHVGEVRADCVGENGVGKFNPTGARYAATMQRCFDRGSSGESPEWRWFVRASDRAEAMTARIRGAT